MLDGVGWRTGGVPDPRLVARFAVGPVDAIAAIERADRLVVAVAATGHYDGDCLWAGRHDCGESVLWLRDLRTGEELATVPATGGQLISLAAVNDRTVLVVADWSKELRCFDLDAQSANVLGDPGAPVQAMAVWQRSGRPFVVCDVGLAGDGAVRAWDLTTGAVEELGPTERGFPKALGVYEGTPVLINRASESNVDKRLRAVRIRRLGDRDVLDEVVVGPEPSQLALSGSILAVARPGLVDLYDLSTGSRLPPLTGLTGWAQLASTTLDGAPHLVTATNRGEVRLWDLTAPAPVDVPRHAEPILAVTFADDGLLVTADMAGTVRRWNAADGSAIGAPWLDRVGPVRSLVNAPTAGRTVLVTAGGAVNQGEDGSLHRWNVVTGAPVGPPLDAAHNGESRCTAALLDGRPVVVSGGNSGHLMLWDPDSGELIRRAETGRFPVNGLAVGSVLGRTVVAISRDVFDPMRFWDLDSWSEVDLAAEDLRFDRVRGWVTDRIGRPTLVTVDGDNTLRLAVLIQHTWQTRTVSYPAPVTAVAAATVPRPIVATAYDDRTVRLIDPTTDSLLAEPLQFPESVQALAISTDGTIAAAFGIDVAVISPEPNTPQVTVHQSKTAS